MREMLSIALDKAEHLKYTNKWRELLSYGQGTQDYLTLAKNAFEVYKDNPKLLAVALLSIKKYVKDI